MRTSSSTSWPRSRRTASGMTTTWTATLPRASRDMKKESPSMTIAHFHPMPDVVTLREAMDRLFEDSVIRPTTWSGLPAGQIAVPVDLWETREAYHLRADLPGLTAEDIDINVTADTVS